jgi:hypothetical protein
MSNNSTPTFEVHRTRQNDKPAARIAINNANVNFYPELNALAKSLGMTLSSTYANCFEIICTTPEQIDAVRPIIAPLFTPEGKWIGA